MLSFGDYLEGNVESADVDVSDNISDVSMWESFKVLTK